MPILKFSTRLSLHPASLISLSTILTGGFSSAAPAVKLANHPTSGLTTFRNLHSARKLQNRVYFGYGDWNGYAACALVSYDPAANVLAVEHSIASDSVEMMREFDGTIYVPHLDPVHHEDFHDYSYRGPDGRWLQSAALEKIHVFDFAKSGGQLVCSTDAGLYSSGDDGRTWALTVGTGDRQYWCFDYYGKIYSARNRFTGGSGSGTAPDYWNHTVNFHDTTADKDLILGLTGKTPGIGIFASGLLFFDGSQARPMKLLDQPVISIRSFTTHGPEVFVLTATPTSTGNSTVSIQKTSNPAASLAPFTKLDITGIPSNAACLELLHGKFYIGTTTGEIWVANADGTETTVVPPNVENRIQDSYGRGLAFSGDHLVVGAPNAFATTFLAGRAEVWIHDNGAWRLRQEINPPVPDFSGWFGRDAALHGDLMAIVEAGHDRTNRDRGGNAKTHVYQLIEGIWTPRAVFDIPFAHTVAIQDDMMVVGTSNQAANQADGWPGVNAYVISRGPDNLAEFKALPQIRAASSSSFGYKSLVRVALMDNLLVVGYSGDPSRGSRGAMEIYRRDGEGFAGLPTRQISVNSFQRYGFSVSAHAGVIAVGAPFEDNSAKNSGAVYIYENSAEPGTPAAIAQKQILYSPVPQAHGEFGAAVAIHDGLLLVGSPGQEVNGVRQRGAVYKFRRQASGEWIPAGEIPPPEASDTEFGIEVACSDRWLAAGSLGCRPGATGLETRVRLIPRSGYEEWLDTHPAATLRLPTADEDADGLPTLLEYTANLPPDQPLRPDAAMGGTEPAGMPALGEADDVGMRPLIFVRPRNDSRVSVGVESSSDLAQWAQVNVEPEVITAGTTHELVRVRVPSGTAKHWWRVRASYKAS